jgi:hypothetical protein
VPHACQQMSHDSWAGHHQQGAAAEQWVLLQLQACMRDLAEQIAEREGQLDAMRCAMAAIEADAARSAEEKAALRRAYDARVAAVQAQVAQLRRRVKDQVRARVLHFGREPACSPHSADQLPPATSIALSMSTHMYALHPPRCAAWCRTHSMLRRSSSGHSCGCNSCRLTWAACGSRRWT